MQIPLFGCLRKEGKLFYLFLGTLRLLAGNMRKIINISVETDHGLEGNEHLRDSRP
jgi:hypothetical protein